MTDQLPPEPWCWVGEPHYPEENTMTRDSARRVIRTFLIAFLGVALPGAFGWLNALTEWARANGQTPFPDARSLAFVGVAAIVAGVIALLNLLVVWLEDATGRGVLRTPGTE